MTKPGVDPNLTGNSKIGIMPGPYPPPIRKPAMNIDFNYRIGEPVTIEDLGRQGVIVAAAVAFQESSVIYWVETGDHSAKWYPERIIQPRRYYTGVPMANEAGPSPGQEKTDEAD